MTSAPDCLREPVVTRTLVGLCVAGVVTMLVWRVMTLGVRVMHTDEAVQALRMAELLEHGTPPFATSADHHGPLLHYVSAGLHWLMGIRARADMTEATVRALPLLGSVAAIAAPLIARSTAGVGVVVSMVLLASSPCVVFHAGYFIQEPLLAALSLVALLLAARLTTPAASSWEAPTLAFVLGLAMACKLTALLLALGVAVALVAARSWPRPTPARVVVCALALVAPVVVFHTAFLTRPGGLVDLVGSMSAVARRASTGELHQHGVGFHLSRLVWFRESPGPVWSEWPVVLGALAALGLVAARWPRAEPWQRVLVVVPWVVLAGYLVLPYKTPWLLLTPLGLMAGSAMVIPSMLSASWRAPLLAGALMLGILQVPTMRHTLGTFSSDPRNPWVYAHTVASVPATAARIMALIDETSPTPGVAAVVGGDCWPYPWYLRSSTRVGYFTTAPAPAAGFDIVLSELAQRDAAVALCGPEPVEEFVALRPEVPLVLVVRRSRWEQWIAEQHP